MNSSIDLVRQSPSAKWLRFNSWSSEMGRPTSRRPDLNKLSGQGVSSRNSLARRSVMAVGRSVRHFISAVIAKYSQVGNPAIFDLAVFPWARTLEQEWQRIRAEADRALQLREGVPSLRDISPDHGGMTDEKWKAFFLWGYGYQIDSNCLVCPATAALVRTIPGLQTAFFSILEPGAHLKPHRGVTKAICTIHLGLHVPANAEHCWMTVGEQKLIWHPGRLLIFDDTYEHEVRNETSEQRVVLLLHVKRPVAFPGSIISELFLACVRASPFIQDALRNLRAWNSKLPAPSGVEVDVK